MPHSVWLIGTQLLALIVAMTIQYYSYDRVWTPLQRFYFSAYVRSQILMRFGISSGTYQLLTIKDAKGTRPAIDTDVTTAPASDGTLVLSKQSVQGWCARTHLRLARPVQQPSDECLFE